MNVNDLLANIGDTTAKDIEKELRIHQATEGVLKALLNLAKVAGGAAPEQPQEEPAPQPARPARNRRKPGPRPGGAARPARPKSEPESPATATAPASPVPAAATDAPSPTVDMDAEQMRQHREEIAMWLAKVGARRPGDIADRFGLGEDEVKVLLNHRWFYKSGGQWTRLSQEARDELLIREDRSEPGSRHEEDEDE